MYECFTGSENKLQITKFILMVTSEIINQRCNKIIFISLKKVKPIMAIFVKIK